jgi:hypothetical protein
MKKYILIILAVVFVAVIAYAETNYNYPQPEIQYNMNKVISDMKELNKKFEAEGPYKAPQLVYLYSDSVPATTMKNIFKSAKKIKSLEFTGCLQGFKGDDDVALRKFIEEQVRKAEIDEMEVRLDPFFFRDLEVTEVPALVYAKCSSNPTHCDYEMIIYGDSNLEYLVSQMANNAQNKADKELLSRVAYEIRQ